MTETPLFLRALAGEDTATAPVWFMRQAGRYLPEYMALKEKHGFWTMMREPELAIEVTLQPIRRLGVDAAILFSDIMTPLPDMGVEVAFKPGPVVAEPLRSRAAIEALRVPEQGEIAPFVGTILKGLRAASPVPVIGFAGAPFTLGCYLVEGAGSKDYGRMRGLMKSDPDTAQMLFDKLATLTARYLCMQVEAGAQAVQLFDSWAGLLDAETYRRFAAPANRRILEAVGAMGVPRIMLAVDAAHLWTEIAALPCEAVSVDWRHPLSVARKAFGARAIQGNLDPAELLGAGETIDAAVDRVMHEGLGGAHIFNLGHGIMKETSPDMALRAIRRAQAFDRRKAP